MLISILIILSLLLILFRLLRGESIGEIRREIKELKQAKEVPHYFWKSLKIVFSFKRLGQKQRTGDGEQSECD